MIFQIIFFILCASLLWEYLKYRRVIGNLSKICAITGGYPFLGILPQFMDPDTALDAALKLFGKLKRNAVVGGFGFTMIGVYDPKLAELIMTTNLDKTEEYGFLKSWLFEGLLTSKTEKWRNQRKLYIGGFTYNFLKDCVSKFNSNGIILTNKLDKYADKGPFQIQDFIKTCSLDIICETVLGTSLNTQSEHNNEFLKSVGTMCDVFFIRTFTFARFWAIYTTIYRNVRKRELKAVEILNKFTKEVIQKRIASGNDSQNSILDLLLKGDNHHMDIADIANELNTFIFAGHDTSSITLCFIIYMLGQHPEVQQMVFNEISTCVGPEDDPTYEQLQSLTYMTMVIKEVLRLYPAVPLVSREITREITHNDAVLPKGYGAYIFIQAMHRNPLYFPDPEKFDPERFHPSKSYPAYAYIPFSNGVRNCIGQKFAFMKMRALLVHILRKFQIVKVPEHRLKLVASITLHSKSGFTVALRKR